MFFSPGIGNIRDSLEQSPVEVFSPLLANYPAGHSYGRKKRKETWNIVVNSGDLRDLDYSDIADGSALPWEIAMWGSQIDCKILSQIARRFQTIADLERERGLVVAQGPELRTAAYAVANLTKRHLELVGRQTLEMDQLKHRRYLLQYPKVALRKIQSEETFLRRWGGLDVCHGPHVIVGASRNFAVYTSDYLVVPPRQIGIVAPKGNESFLKALALYLNSDFVAYHQFFTATEAGIQKTRGTLKALKSLPVPFQNPGELKPWEELYSRLVKETEGRDDFDEEVWVPR